jgi:hypothetical protein
MKGGAVYNQSNTTARNTIDQNRPATTVQPASLSEDQRLLDLGFEDGELEALEENTAVTADMLMQKYLEIARSVPYNIIWNSEQEARVDSRPVKRGIAKATSNYYLGAIGQGGKNRKSRKSRKRKSRKSKKSRKTKKTRRSRR